MLEDKITSLSAASTDETIGTALAMNGYDRGAWEVVGSAGVSAGVVDIEWAGTADYAGTWLQLDQITVLASTTLGTAQEITGGFMRARVSTAIANGTVTVYLRRSVQGLY